MKTVSMAAAAAQNLYEPVHKEEGGARLWICNVASVVSDLNEVRTRWKL